MQHALRPFAYGSREGDVVLRLHVAVDEDPGVCADALRQIYARASFAEIWLDAAVLSGAHGRALALALRAHGWNTLAVGAADHQLWPMTPGRIVLDVSSYLAEPIEDVDRWLDDVSRAAARLPQVDEIFAVGPVVGALTAHALSSLETLLAPAEGCTLYLTSDVEQAPAIDACARHGRPWAIRRAGPLQLAERVPVGVPVG